MSTKAIVAEGPVATPATNANPWLIAVVVALAAFMEVLDTTIANVVLRYIAGGLGISEDEASWVVTTYLVANAIIVMATGFLAQRFGRKAFFLACLGLFTVSSVLCGVAWNLQSLLLFRILQGLGGGGMVPVAQSILADSFPPHKRGQAFALFGVAVVVAPAVGPTLGGWIADSYSWQWCFLINGPVGVASMALVYALVNDTGKAEQTFRFDWQGFMLVATFLGALEVVLDRGQVDDWFTSNFIVTFSIISALAFLLLIPWEATRKNPTVDIQMMATLQFGSSFLNGLPPGKTDQASALMNAARNTGGSIGVSLASNVLAHREQFHQSRLAENAIPSSISYQDTLQQITHYFVAQGSSLAQAHSQAVAWIGQQVQAQASLLAYVDVFWTLMVMSLATAALAFVLRKNKLGEAPPAAH